MELRQEVVGPLDRAGHHLGKEEHVDGVDEKVPLGLPAPPVDLDGVAHRLEGVKREPDGQRETEEHGVRGHPEGAAQSRDVLAEEVEVLEDAQDSDVGDEADEQDALSRGTLGSVDQEAGRVIDCDQHEQNDDVGGNERHVEVAAGDEEEW